MRFVCSLVCLAALGCRSSDGDEGRTAPPDPSCQAVAQHALSLMPADLRQVDEQELARMCATETTIDQRRCVMAARTFDEFRRCGPAKNGPATASPSGPPAQRPAPSGNPTGVEEIRRAGERIRGAVEPCRAELAKSPSTTTVVRYTYTLVVEHGQARAEEVKVNEADAPPAARECVARAIAALRWQSAAPDGRSKVKDGFTR